MPQLNGTATTQHEIEHAGIGYQLVVTPIIDGGQLLGAAVEWRSRALETTVETEVAALVDAAAQGQLHGRIETRASRASCSRWRSASTACWIPSRATCPACRRLLSGAGAG